MAIGSGPLRPAVPWRGMAPDPRQATRLLQRLADRWRLACALLSRLQRQRTANVYHLGCVLSGCQKAAQWTRALSLHHGVASVVCSSSQISACGDAKQWRRSQELFAAMCRAGEHPRAPLRRLYNITITT